MRTKTKIFLFIILIGAISTIIKLKYGAYGVYGPDSLIHFKISQDIMNDQSVNLSRETQKGSYYWFFMLHLESVILSLLTGVGLAQISVLFMPIMTSVVSIFVFILCRKFFDDKTGIIAVVIFSFLSILVSRGSQFIPEMIGLVFVVCLLNYMDFIVSNKHDKRVIVPLLFFFGLLFSHHLMNLLLFIFMFSYFFMQFFENKNPDKKIIIFMVAVSLLYWFISGFVFYRLLMSFFPMDETMTQFDITQEILAEFGYESTVISFLVVPLMIFGLFFFSFVFLFYLYKRKQLKLLFEKLGLLLIPLIFFFVLILIFGISTNPNIDSVIYNLDKILILTFGFFGIFELLKRNSVLFPFFYISLALIFLMFFFIMLTQSTVISPPRIMLYSSIAILVPCARVLQKVDLRYVVILIFLWSTFSFHFAFPTVESGRAWFRQYYLPHEYSFLEWSENYLGNESFVSSKRMTNLIWTMNDLSPTKIYWITLDSDFCYMNISSNVTDIIITEDMLDYGIMFSSYKPTFCDNFDFLNELDKIYSNSGGLSVFKRF